MTEIGFNRQTIGTAPANEECAEVSATGGNNALPFVVGFPPRTDARVKVFALADIECRELIRADLATRDVDAAARQVRLRDRVNLKLVLPPTGANPSNKPIGRV